MKHFALGTLFLILGASCAVTSPHHPYGGRAIPPDILEWSQTNVYKVKVATGQGSGFWVDNNNFLTACHVVSHSFNEYGDDGKGNNTWQEVWFKHPQADIISFDGKSEFTMKVVTCNRDTDIAVLQPMTDPGKEATHVARSTVPQGTMLWGPGYGLGESLYISEGHMQNQSPYREDWFLTTVFGIYGDSGSPLLAVHYGEIVVVGMRSAMRVLQNESPVTHLVLSPEPRLLLEELEAAIVAE